MFTVKITHKRTTKCFPAFAYWEEKAILHACRVKAHYGIPIPVIISIHFNTDLICQIYTANAKRILLAQKIYYRMYNSILCILHEFNCTTQVKILINCL